MDERIVERVLGDDSSQRDDSSLDSFPHYNPKKLLHGRLIFALPLMILALIPTILLGGVINAVVPSFFAFGNLFVSIIFLIALSVVTLGLYLNTRIRRRHKLVTGGAYGFIGLLFLLSPVVEAVSTRSLPATWKILFGILLGGVCIRYAKIVVRSHYREGPASWAVDE